MTAIFLSDVHLRDNDSVKTRLVLRFLQEVASRFDRIYILGDLFDVWPGSTPYLEKSFRPITDVLKSLATEGRQVHYVEGNHDFRLGRFFSESLGIQVHPDGLTETFNGRRTFLAHGDLGNPKEWGYRLLRKLLRSEWLHFGLKAVPGEWVYRLGNRTSRMSHGYQMANPHRKAIEERVRQIYRRSAEDLFARGYDVVIMGHTHVPDDFSSTVEGRQCRYINTGDWVRNFTYLEFDGSDFYTKSHPVKDL